MKQKADEFSFYPLTLTLHESHPAYGLHPDVRDRLTNGFDYRSKELKRRFSKQSLVRLATHSIIVAGSKSKPFVVSGWAVFHLLQAYNIDDEIVCRADWSVTGSRLREICYQDFFIQPQIDRNDEISQRIRAILMDKSMSDDLLKDMLFIDAATPESFYSLPAHKQNRLQKSIESETAEVRKIISEVERPLGSKVPNENKGPLQGSDQGDDSLSETKELLLRKEKEQVSEEKSENPSWRNLFGSSK